jgi:hypothetical protein
MNGERRRTTISRFIKRESKDGMTKESRRSSHPETRYYSLIPRLNYLGMENYEASGKDHSR